MKKVDIPMLLLAALVTMMFILVGVAIAFRSVLFITLFFLLGFLIMSFGIRLKKKKLSENH